MAPEVRSCLRSLAESLTERRPTTLNPATGVALWNRRGSPGRSRGLWDMLGLDGVPRHLGWRPFGDDAGRRFRSRISTDGQGTAVVRGFAWRSNVT
jgi:hypothetical protein